MTGMASFEIRRIKFGWETYDWQRQSSSENSRQRIRKEKLLMYRGGQRSSERGKSVMVMALSWEERR